jgi:radical SAM family uncharacterized protein
VSGRKLPNWLTEVSKPARYTGGELNAVQKDSTRMDLRFALAFPDVYEIAMSHLGIKILYEILNDLEWVWAERVFAPWPDMAERMAKETVPLYGLESGDPVAAFDVIGFTLQYELSYSNILYMLDLAGIPLQAAQRSEKDPLIIAGGPCTYNPEPLADFLDAVVLGEGEEVIVEIAELLRKLKQAGAPRREKLAALAGLPGVYVPSFYQVEYAAADQTLSFVRPVKPGIPERITKRIVQNYEAAPFPVCPPVPFIDIVQDRIALEIQRGCTRGCRFCQAGMVYRPVRERSPEKIKQLMDANICSTGYAEITLSSLSSADHSCIAELAADSIAQYGASGVTISLPSLRADAFSVALAEKMESSGRKSSLTFAPEAGTQRLRDVINKGVREEDLIDAVESATAAGWRSFKLYFMIGLPTETEEDLEAIGALARIVLSKARAAVSAAGAKGKNSVVTVTVSASTFVPKANTPFQWRPQDPIATIRQKQDLLRRVVRGRGIDFQWHDPETSFLEAVFARGDRRLGAVLEKAWRSGCKFDGWNEYFDFDLWQRAFAECGIDPTFYANRQRDYQEVLPWNHLSAGVDRSYLISEDQKAGQAALTEDCRTGECLGCGVCQTLDTQPSISKAVDTP